VRFLTILCGGLLVFSFAACQTTLQAPQAVPPPLPKPDARWKIRLGQLQYRKADRSIIGECVASWRGEQDFMLEYHAGPGFLLLRLQASGPFVQAEGPLARGAWQGEKTRIPKHLKGWLEAAAAMRSGAERVQTDSPETGETFRFVFVK
jgi:hypothetical protein